MSLPLQVVGLRAEINARDVFHPHKRTVRIRPNDNLAKFLRRLQSSLRAHGISEFLSAWNRFAADLAGGIHRVLLLHCGDDVGHSDAELRELVRLDPQPHSVLASAENLHIANSRHACQWIEEINVAVIGEKGSVVAAFGRIKRDQHQWRRCRFFNGQAVVVNVGGQLRLRLRHPELRQHVIDVRVGCDVEIDDQSNVATVRVDRVHVVHVVDAAHLLLDRRRDRLLDRQRVRAGVVRLHLNLRRRDLRILRDRQRQNADAADERHQNRDYDRDDGPPDEELRHLLGLLLLVRF